MWIGVSVGGNEDKSRFFLSGLVTSCGAAFRREISDGCTSVLRVSSAHCLRWAPSRQRMWLEINRGTLAILLRMYDFLRRTAWQPKRTVSRILWQLADQRAVNGRFSLQSDVDDRLSCESLAASSGRD